MVDAIQNSNQEWLSTVFIHIKAGLIYMQGLIYTPSSAVE